MDRCTEVAPLVQPTPLSQGVAQPSHRQFCKPQTLWPIGNLGPHLDQPRLLPERLVGPVMDQQGGRSHGIGRPSDNCALSFGLATHARLRPHSPPRPKGDQPTAIKQLVQGVNDRQRYQTLLGATGTGKTFTMANVIAQTGRPALVLAHNKTLAAQLCNELREFFPENAVEYFISYYDYYQPEAYVPVSDTYIAKTASINEEIDMLRHSATRSLFERRDVIVVASISCIYGLGIPSEYLKAAVKFEVGETLNIRGQLRSLVNNQYSRNDTEIARGRFRMKGMCWKSAPPTKTVWCGLSYSATRWRRFAMSTPPLARSCRAWTR